jgi:NAD(P) transhydrogenase
MAPRGRDDYDLIVIGAGPAGERGATAAAFFGRRVAVIEREPNPGGAAANTGTLPSKTLRETALALSGLKTRHLYGVDLSLRRAATIADLMFHETRVVQHERERILANLRASAVELVQGDAAFVDPHTVRVAPGGRLLRGRVVLIATGSSPVRPAEFPFDDPRVRDSDGILRLERLPQRLVVAGAGWRSRAPASSAASTPARSPRSAPRCTWWTAASISCRSSTARSRPSSPRR